MAKTGGGCLKVFLGFILAGLLVGGLIWFLPNLDRVLTHEKVEGVVVDLIPSVDSDGDTVYAPVYEYQVDGRSYRYKSKVSLGGFVVPDLGDTRTLLYNPDNPADARVNNTLLLLVLPGLLVLIATLALLALVVTSARRAWQRQRKADWLAMGDRSVRAASVTSEPNRVTVTATFMGAEASPMDNEGRVRYRVRAKAEIEGKMQRFESEWLDEDPTLGLMQRGNLLEVSINPDDPTNYDVIIPE